MSETFTWGSAGEKLSPAERRRRVAESMLAKGSDTSPVQHWTQGAARVVQALMGGWQMRQANEAEAAGQASVAAEPALMPPAAAPSMAGGGATRAVGMPAVAPEVKDGIVQTASALGIDPVDLATTISYETGGTFDPTKRGPTTKWGQHRGLIQFGEPQAKQHGVDWNNPVGSQLGPNGAVASYLRTAGVKPGMGILDIYSAINAGAPGLYNRSDTAAGGAPGTVRDKVEQQMGGHRAKALKLLGMQTAAADPDMPAPDAAIVASETGQPGFAIPTAAPHAPAMTAQNFDAITSGEKPLDPAFQAEGAAQPWMGTALPPAGPQMAQAPLPSPRPADLRADMPAPGAVPAMGQMPPPQVIPQPDFTSADNAGSREFVVQQEQMRRGQAPAPQEAVSPISRVAAAFTGGGQQAAPAAAPSAAVQTVAQAVGPSAAPAAASPAVDRVASAMRVLNSPYAAPAQRAIAQMVVAQAFKDPSEAEAKKLDLEIKRKTLTKSDDPTPIQEYNLAVKQGETRSYTDWKTAQTKAGATSVNVNGGGSDKQIFDTVKESADAAKSAAVGLVAVREARKSIQAGAILGAGADAKLQLQKIGAAIGVADPAKIVNTETFRSAIAPAVASLLKSTVGSANISNSDREFAEKAAGGSITLDEGTITRLLDIMERGNMTILEGHQKRLDAIYPDDVANKRERALFGVQMPTAPAASAPASPDRSALEAEARRRGLLK